MGKAHLTGRFLLGACSIALATILALGACADSAPADPRMPDGYTLYPGAQIIDSTSIQAADGSGKIVVIRSSDITPKVVAFYRDQAAENGIEMFEQTDASTFTAIAGEGPGGNTFSLNAAPDGEGTIVQIVAGKGS